MKGAPLSRTIVHSFGYAFRGLAEAWRSERNFRVQCVYAAAVACLLVWLRPDSAPGLLVVLCMSVLLAAELMNSALERAVDLAFEGLHPLARMAKDLAASSVLVVAMATAVINLWVFGSLIAPASQVAFAGFMVGLGGLRFLRGGRS